MNRPSRRLSTAACRPAGEAASRVSPRNPDSSRGRGGAGLPGLAAAGLSLAVAGFALWTKVRLYGGMAFGTDLFVNHQMATSVLGGRAPLSDNFFGSHLGIHAYWLLPLLGPFDFAFGPPGLFVAYGAAWAAAAFLFMGAAAGREARWTGLLAGAALALGPAALWIAAALPDGFNADILFFPLSILFAAALEKSPRNSLAPGAALLLLREEGAVVLWALVCAHFLFREGDAAGPRRTIHRLAAVTVVSVAVFSANLAAVRWAAPGPSRSPGRLDQALARLCAALADGSAARVLLPGTLAGLGALAAGSLACAALAGPRRAAACLAFCLPAAVTAAVASLAPTYRGAGAVESYGLLWAPRLAPAWGMLCGACLISLGSPGRRAARRRPVPTACVAGLALCSVAAQAWVFASRGAWDLGERLSPLRVADGRSLPAALFSPAELEFLHRLDASLPAGTSVAASPALFARLDRHDLVWPSRVEFAWARPAVVVCDEAGRTGPPDSCLALRARIEGEGARTLRTGRISATIAARLGPLPD